MKILNKGILSLMLSLGLATAAFGEDYGLPTDIQEGNILHCFDWTMADVKAELPNIAAAGFGSVQISPVQRADAKTGMEWHALYRPYDLAFKSSGLGSEADLKALCEEAAKYGIKIIVDVVANHVDKSSGYHDTWWDSNGRVRWNGSINYGDRYSITHGQLGDYGDVNSEDAEVIARCKAYVEKLKSLGVKGIRWDAAKHIALPSEGCNFWSTMTSVSGMWHYGEILDAPGPNSNIIKEYVQYMSVTDNRYSNNAARNNGGIPSSAAGEWVSNQGCSDSKIVYWGESHDTYCNDEWSQNVDQSVIDRAYAAMACRKGATALYFSRPSTKGFSNIKVGKGSTAFKNKQVAEVNKFRNAMQGKAEYCTNNGNAFCVTRQNGGAVIVMKGSGNVSITNGGGYAKPGTYVDKVSGNTFTVTSSTISGNVGSTGIAVLYDGTTSTDPDPEPEPDPDPSTGDSPDQINGAYLKNTANWSNPTVWAWTDGGNCTSATAWPGDAMTKSGDYWKWEVPAGKATPTMIIFSDGGNSKTADLVFVNSGIYDCSGSQIGTATGGSGSGTDPGTDPGTGGGDDTDAFTIYYDDSASNFGSVNIHYWSNPQTSWPGVALTNVSGNIWKYTFTQDPSTLSGFLFCNSSGSNQTADYNGAPVKNHLYKGSGGKGAVTDEGVYGGGSEPVDPEDPEEPEDPDEPVDPGTPGVNLITDYYKVNPNGQYGSNRTVSMSFNGEKSTTALSNWTEADMIAQGVARDVCMAFKGKHERPVVDSYAIYAAYDNDNLYLGVQTVYTVWDQYGEGKQPGESKPHNMDGRLMWAFDLNPSKKFDGYINGQYAIWNGGDELDGAYFDNGVDAVWVGSTKPGVGTPGFFTPTADGHASYDNVKSIPGSYYGYADGLLPSIKHIYGSSNFEYDPAQLEGNDGFTDLIGEIDPSAHTFYEFKFPLSVLGVSANYIKNTGIGVMWIDVYGSSPVGGTPYDPSYFDNVKKDYPKDKSTSYEKCDKDIITYGCARIGRGQSAVETISDDANGDFLVSTGNGTLTVTGNGTLTVAGIDGNIYFHGNADSALSLSLGSGLYIVNLNGHSVKALVK